MFEEGTDRVFAFSDEPAPWTGEWLVVIISIPHRAADGAQEAVRRSALGGAREPDTRHLADAARRSRCRGRPRHRAARSPLLDAVLRRTASRRSGSVMPRSSSAPGTSSRSPTTYQELLARFSRLDPGTRRRSTACTPRADKRTAALSRSSTPSFLRLSRPGWIGREATRRLRDLDARWSVGARARWRAITVDDGSPVDRVRRGQRLA